MIKILLAEDHHIVRDGIRIILENEPDMKVIFEAANGGEMLDYLEHGEKPDVILTDMNMPGLDGLDLIAALPKFCPILVLSMLDHEKYIFEAMRAGAHGYLLKNVDKQEMVFAIRHVANGGSYICSEIALKLLNNYARTRSEPPVAVELTEREAEILNFIAEGFTNKQMAEKLFTSRRTIEGHRQSLMDKTGSTNTATLIKFAVMNGLIE